MASFSVTPGLNAIIPKLQNTDGAGRDVASGDVCTLLNGTYTFNTAQAILLDQGGLGLSGPLTSLTIQGESRDGVIIDMSGVTFDAIYGGNATNVILKDVTLTGTPGAGVVRDNANSPMTGWTFQNIKLDALTKTFFSRTTASPGVGITFNGIVTTANYAAPLVMDILGTNGDLDLKIIDVDARLHTAALTHGIRIQDGRDVRMDGIKVANPTTAGIYIQSFDVAKGVYDVDMFNIECSGAANTAPMIYVGNQSAYKVTKRVRVHGAIVSASASYGIEFEGGVEDSEICNCIVTNCVNNGIPIPDSTRNILVADNFIDGVTGALNSGIALVCGRRHRVLRNVITNCFCAIRHDENGDVGQAADGVNVLDNQRNIVRDNVIGNVSHAYRVTANSMPPNAAGAHPVGAEASTLSNQFGPNIIFTPTVAFCQIDSVNKTQAEFEAAFPKSIERTDTVLNATNPAAPTYSTQQALNILAGNRTAPYTGWSTQYALNRLIGNTTGNPNKFTSQYVTNSLI